jgi:hypothetical protein
VHPVAGSQLATQHSFVGLQVGADPATQLPAPSHASPTVHADESVHVVPAAFGVCTQPTAGSQFAVQHCPFGEHGIVEPERQVPAPLQTSPVVHADPSEQGVENGFGTS